MVTKDYGEKQLNCPTLEEHGVKWCWDYCYGAQVCTACRRPFCVFDCRYKSQVRTHLTADDRKKLIKVEIHKKSYDVEKSEPMEEPKSRMVLPHLVYRHTEPQRLGV